jgi:hypothetical protein
VLLNVKRKVPLATFFRTINSRPIATSIVESSAIDQDRELLKDMYYQDDRRADGCNLLLSEALAASDVGPATDKLKMAAKLLRDSKEHVTQVAALEDAQKLLRFQEAFEKDLNERFVGLSVNDTMSKLIKMGNMKRSQKVQTEFKVSDKTYCWVRLRALVVRRDWRELEEISKTRKSPIGWEVSGIRNIFDTIENIQLTATSHTSMRVWVPATLRLLPCTFQSVQLSPCKSEPRCGSSVG